MSETAKFLRNSPVKLKFRRQEDGWEVMHKRSLSKVGCITIIAIDLVI